MIAITPLRRAFAVSDTGLAGHLANRLAGRLPNLPASRLANQPPRQPTALPPAAFPARASPLHAPPNPDHLTASARAAMQLPRQSGTVHACAAIASSSANLGACLVSAAIFAGRRFLRPRCSGAHSRSCVPDALSYGHPYADPTLRSPRHKAAQYLHHARAASGETYSITTSNL